MTNLSALQVMDAAILQFGSLLAQVAEADWTRPTPCSEWNIGELVGHVSGAARTYTALVEGQSFDVAMLAGDAPDLDSQDRRAHFHADALQLRAAFESPDTFARVFDVPGGSVTGDGLRPL